MVVVAMKKIQSLPERRKDPRGYDQFLKFERGLHEFFNSTMKRSYVAIRNELDEGQTLKKRAVIQLINITQSGQKKMFNRWQNLTEKAKLVNECRLVSNFLASLTYTIKSATDSCFIDNKENTLKEKALIQLFKNMGHNVSDTFKRWRDVNNIEKLRERMTAQQKEAVINVLGNLLHHNKREKIAEVIRRFR